MLTEAPDCLRIARRMLEHLPFCEIVDDLSLCENHWTIHFSVQIKSTGEIPSETFWYAILPEAYPYGEIELYPAKKGGIEKTYWHQSYNSPGRPYTPWREGNPCVSTNFRFWGRKQYDAEPYDAETRLAWHVDRLRDWLIAADAGNLVHDGDPFEMPHYPGLSHLKSFGYFNGDAATYSLISRESKKYGLAHVRRLRRTDAWMLTALKSNSNAFLLKCPKQEVAQEDAEKAIWVELQDVPHLSPWQGVRTFGELRVVIRESGVDLDSIIAQYSASLRDGKRHLLILGFPVTECIGGSEVRQGWIACRLPILAHGKIKGFRSTPEYYAVYDRIKRILTDDVEIEWLDSRCWDDSEVLSRGSLSSSARKMKFAIIGLGALGSCLVELLARMGVKDFLLIDGETLEIGNLTRHTLGLSSLGLSKSMEIAERLRTIEPSICVKALHKSIEMARLHDGVLLEEADVFVDCTGDDAVLYNLAAMPFENTKRFISVSIGLGAEMLFVYGAKAASFPFNDFKDKVNPYIDQEKEKWKGVKLPRAGIGCWNPVFPARVDDIWMMTSVAVKEIEEIVNDVWQGLRIFSLKKYEQSFVGVEQILLG